MNDEIILPKVNDNSEPSLPKGVRALVLQNNIIFVHRVMGKWMPVDSTLQEELRNKHVNPGSVN